MKREQEMREEKENKRGEKRKKKEKAMSATLAVSKTICSLLLSLKETNSEHQFSEHACTCL